MDLILLITGFVQIVLSLVIGILLIYSASKIFQKLIKGINESEEIKNNNVAVAILNSAIVLSIILIVRNSIETAINIFSNTIRNPESVITTYLKTAGLMLGHIILSTILAFTSVYIALKFFMWLTKDLDELAEIKDNNIAVSVFLSIIIISLSLILEPGIRTILDALIPFPPVSFIDIGS